MTQISKEVTAKLVTAKNYEEAMKILADNGLTLTDEELATINKEFDALPSEGELSVDELEAISGGWRDWLTEGCYATVEANSTCAYSNDNCLIVYHHYDHGPYPFQWCNKCHCQMGLLCLEQMPGDIRYSDKLKCPKCGDVRWAHPK